MQNIEQKYNAPIIPDTKSYPKAMIIANQNVNGDDLTTRLDQIYREDIQHPIVIIKVNNIDTERDQLIRGYMPRRDDDIHEEVTMADILDAGVHDASLANYVNNKGNFAPRRYGGVYRLEAIMKVKLSTDKYSGLDQELRNLGNPNQVYSREQRMSVKKSLDKLIRDILDEAHVVICTFAVAYHLTNRKLFKPLIVDIDEASRKHKANIRWCSSPSTHR